MNAINALIALVYRMKPAWRLYSLGTIFFTITAMIYGSIGDVLLTGGTMFVIAAIFKAMEDS